MDYEQVLCDICGQFTQRGYLSNTGRILCGRCSGKQIKARSGGSL